MEKEEENQPNIKKAPSMNLANIDTLILSIENETIDNLGFNMGTPLDRTYGSGGGSIYPDQTGRHCGTVACLGGWSWLLLRGGDKGVVDMEVQHGIGNQALIEAVEEFLDIDTASAQLLCFPPESAGRFREISWEVAKGVLIDLKETGKIFWPFSPSSFLSGEAGRRV